MFQDTANHRGFTLIELIVVIAILVVLSTIGFMNYTSYTISAKDMKRKSDLTIINNTLQKLITQGVSVNSFVSDTQNTGTGAGNFSLNGMDLYASGGTIYTAGSINIDNLQDIGKENIDPKTKKGYILGVFGNKYEIAGSLEESNMAYILANYKKRTASGTISSLTGSIDMINYSINLINYSDSMKFTQGDTISTGGTMAYTIGAVQGTKIYLNTPPLGILSTDIIRLAQDETDIIGSNSNGTGTGTSCITEIINIEKNRCPISDSISGLMPYSLK